jgi:putative ABC transport system permease protein
MAFVTATDLRLAFRTLQTRPGLAAVIIGTLALGIGASTAMFSVLNAALLRPLPFAEAGRLVVMLGVAGPERSVRGASIPEVHDWRVLNRTMTDVSVFDQISLNLGTETGAERIIAERVNAGYFPLLGVAAARGRTFTPEEDSLPDAHPVAVVSHSFWRNRFGSDPTMVGRTITLNGRAVTVVGIMPEGFGGVSFQAEVWFPVALISIDSPVSLLTTRGSRWLPAVGRLRDDINIADARRDLMAVAARLAGQYPETNRERSVDLQSLQDSALGSTKALFAALFQAVLLVLLIACANVMSLQLVRATSREREISLRLALGAGRLQLVRQLLTEGMVLAGLGGIAGLLLAFWCLRLLLPLAPAGLLPAYAQVGVDGRVLAFSAGITLLCGLVCGLAPALRSGRGDLSDALRQGVRASSSGLRRLRKPGMQQLLVAGEVALALILLVGAGLMLKDLRRRVAVPPGFQAEGVLAARVSLPRDRYPVPERISFAERLVDRLSALPDVVVATVGTDMPLRGFSNAASLTTDLPGAEPARHFRHGVTPRFFEVLGIPILAGRGFTAADLSDSPRVAVVSDATARRLWPGQDPLGRRFHLGDLTGPEVTVVGVAASARFRDLTNDLATPAGGLDVFFPFTQRTDADLEIAVRSRTGAGLSAAALQAQIAAIDPQLPLYLVQPLEEAVRSQNAAPRFGSLVLGVFSALALVLSAIGVYGVIAFVVGLSRREIAIRLALGADGRKVLGVVMANGMTLVLGGVAVGLVGARLGAKVLASQLYGVPVTDTGTFLGVTAVVTLVACLACWLPARRAARVDPQAVLKGE